MWHICNIVISTSCIRWTYSQQWNASQNLLAEALFLTTESTHFPCLAETISLDIWFKLHRLGYLLLIVYLYIYFFIKTEKLSGKYLQHFWKWHLLHIFQVLFAVTSFYYTVNLIIAYKKEGCNEFFNKFWNQVDLFTVLLSIVAMVLYLVLTFVLVQNMKLRVSVDYD